MQTDQTDAEINQLLEPYILLDRQKIITTLRAAVPKPNDEDYTYTKVIMESDNTSDEEKHKCLARYVLNAELHGDALWPNVSIFVSGEWRRQKNPDLILMLGVNLKVKLGTPVMRKEAGLPVDVEGRYLAAELHRLLTEHMSIADLAIEGEKALDIELRAIVRDIPVSAAQQPGILVLDEDKLVASMRSKAEPRVWAACFAGFTATKGKAKGQTLYTLREVPNDDTDVLKVIASVIDGRMAVGMSFIAAAVRCDRSSDKPIAVSAANVLMDTIAKHKSEGWSIKHDSPLCDKIVSEICDSAVHCSGGMVFWGARAVEIIESHAAELAAGE